MLWVLQFNQPLMYLAMLVQLVLFHFALKKGLLKYHLPLIYHPCKPFKGENESFPGGAVVKNPPANAGDMGSIPGLGRSHMPQSN